MPVPEIYRTLLIPPLSPLLLSLNPNASTRAIPRSPREVSRRHPLPPRFSGCRLAPVGAKFLFFWWDLVARFPVQVVAAGGEGISIWFDPGWRRIRWDGSSWAGCRGTPRRARSRAPSASTARSSTRRYSDGSALPWCLWFAGIGGCLVGIPLFRCRLMDKLLGCSCSWTNKAGPRIRIIVEIVPVVYGSVSFSPFA